jgi:hypothetical protein
MSFSERRRVTRREHGACVHWRHQGVGAAFPQCFSTSVGTSRSAARTLSAALLASSRVG